ncbi:FtsQ-type POTRA domain-containing protein [Nostoc sp. FACHB-973]|uniref:FtsQ-type POTRA domain-containing protein n=1 Tax=Desmonostoc muscorum LEGE 12446 TaxID=1828758 RepID=A0A8J7D1D3_DESMC|nr:FtsQ-type POTRA domain-containing protein [Desmonostoc muscorum]MBD2520572.1 FtsQ-type POTRA domain-containing protein [Nostoc sp. FACHB-973]MBX9254760.1 FtsQ-type POTRA domain-containing protein [Desmonostoc muscorum CCALA 125]MCF2148027.1 FtsQ-type POTRA domain-containing protein [Desmonostoc muscorum LEGE 12446]
MAGIISVSRTDLAQRRKKLRRQRQMRIIQAIWRTFAIIGLASGLFWVAVQPVWMLKASKQIVMKSGNKLLSDETTRSLLVLSYPQSLWRIEPSAIANSLKKQPTIANAIVRRRLFPPGLIIDIQERVPVAVTQTPTVQNQGTSNNKVTIGLLDASGVWMPLEKYTSLNPNKKLPNLRVIGSPKQYCLYWTQLHQAINQSPVKVMEIDCQNPTNLILKTELGNVHLGAPSPQLPEQIKVLAQMRHLKAKLNSGQIEYIDLKNPEFPLVQMNQENPKLTPKIPRNI